MSESEQVHGKVLLERARTMVPALRERAREAEKLQRLPDTTIGDAVDAGLFRAFVPKRHGGLQVDFRYGPLITRELAHGCLSSAWIISFYIQHNWQAGLFPEALQSLLWKDRPYILAPAHIIPSGSATPVKGGYRVNGKWPWGSGIQHAEWFFAAAVVPGDGPLLDTRYFVIPAEQTALEGSWDVSGLAGTGSNTIVVDDVFVAEEMHGARFAQMLDGSAPGVATQEPYLWQIPMVPLLMYNSLGAMAVGAAETAYQIFINLMDGKSIKYGGGKAKENSAVHMRAGRARMNLTAISNLFEANIEKIEERTRSGNFLNEFERLEIMAESSHIVHAARRLIDDLCEGAGSSFNFLSNPLQRIRRDMNVLATHGITNLDRSTENYGKVLLGHDIPLDSIR